SGAGALRRSRHGRGAGGTVGRGGCGRQPTSRLRCLSCVPERRKRAARLGGGGAGGGARPQIRQPSEQGETAGAEVQAQSAGTPTRGATEAGSDRAAWPRALGVG